MYVITCFKRICCAGGNICSSWSKSGLHSCCSLRTVLWLALLISWLANRLKLASGKPKALVVVFQAQAFDCVRSERVFMACCMFKAISHNLHQAIGHAHAMAMHELYALAAAQQLIYTVPDHAGWISALCQLVWLQARWQSSCCLKAQTSCFLYVRRSVHVEEVCMRKHAEGCNVPGALSLALKAPGRALVASRGHGLTICSLARTYIYTPPAPTHLDKAS